MQLTNLQVMNALQALTTLSREKLPIKLAWKVNIANKALEPFAKAVDEPMSEIRTRYAVRDENGDFVPAQDAEGNPMPNTVQIPNDKIAVVNTEMEELMAQTVDVHNVEFKLSEFPDTLELQPNVLNGLMPLIRDDSPPELSLVK
jgi:hypothetical protein